MTNQGPPAGWYPHPEMADTQRYWDGANWSDAIAPMPPRFHAVQPSEASDGLVLAGWILTFLMPCVGFVLGIVVAAKGSVGHGVGMIASSVAVAIGWNILLSLASYSYY